MEIGNFIKKFMTGRKLTQATLAKTLGYKSANSLVRLIQGTANRASVEKFARLLSTRFALDSREAEELETAVRISLRGKQGYLAEREMWAFLEGKTTDDAEAETVIEDVCDASHWHLAERYADANCK